jgi:hypothetical protein
MAAKTNIKSITAFAAALAPVQAALATWRKGRKHREPIPQACWRAMVPLARAHGVSAVAQALRVNYTALKRQVLASRAAPAPGTVSHPGFVEIPIASGLAGSQWVIALEDRLGLKLTVQLPQGGNTEVLALARQLWRERA